MNVSTKKTVDPTFAKGKVYRKVIEDISRAAVCPFCPEYFKWHTKPFLRRSGGWVITENFNPYKNADKHFIIVSGRHIEKFEDLTANDWKYLSSLTRWAIKKFKIPGGAIALRFGETAYTGATVCHLHAHLIVPKLKKGRAQTVWFPIG